MKRNEVVVAISLILAMAFALRTGRLHIAFASDQVLQTPLSGKSIPKYFDPLETFVGARVQAGTGYTVSMNEFQQQVLPSGYPMTTVWGYKVDGQRIPFDLPWHTKKRG